MVKRRKKITKKKRNRKEFKQNGTKARKINSSTAYKTCNEWFNCAIFALTEKTFYSIDGTL